MSDKFLKFPANFYWGAATSAHQVEGGTDNDWSVWEKSEKRLMQLRGEGKDPSGFISGRAADHYNRYAEDFDIAKELGHNMHRISVEWSRIEPEEGKFDSSALQHYRDVVKAIRERGMEPMVTLWHFTTPKWLAVKGGVLNKRFPELYKRFISTTVDNLKGDVKYWVTFNEATTVYAGAVYLKGYWPPQHRSIYKWYKLRKNIKTAHTLAYRAIKDIYAVSPILPYNGSPSITSHNVGGVFVGSVESISFMAMPIWMRVFGLEKIFNYFYYHWFWRRTLPYQDFLGLNYYSLKRLPGSLSNLSRQDTTEEMNWEIYPKGLYYVIMALKKFKKPVLITENGIADAADKKREKFIVDHLFWIHKAIEGGVDVRGYLYWSLLDNFEWAKGFGPRFGLVATDYATQQRTIRPSARVYAKIIEGNGFEVESSSSL